MRLIGDLEANGLLEEADRLWCGVFKDIDTHKVYKFYPGSHDDWEYELLNFLNLSSVCIMHNGVGFDWPLLSKLYQYKYKGEKVDTLCLSRTRCPHIKRPVGCKAGPHSVEAWGIRFGRHKPEHEDWSQFSEEMLHRCSEDVEIQEMLYHYLIDNSNPEEWEMCDRLTLKLFTILQKMEEHGVLADRKQMLNNIQRLNHWIDRIDSVIFPRLPYILVKGNEIKKPFKKDGDYSHHVYKWADLIEIDLDEINIRGPFSRLSFRKINLDSVKEIKEYLLSLGWEPQHWNRNDEGQPTSPKLSHLEEFKGIEGALGRLVARRVQCRHRRSQIEGWLSNIRMDGRIPQVVTGLATTGRATHAKIVNVPGKDSFFGNYMRKCFKVRDGYKLVGVDSAGCQNRMLAARVGNDFFTKTLLEGKKEDETSIHFVNRRAINGDGEFDVNYHEAKTLNYAFMFGASNKKLGSTIGMDAQAGERIREALLGVAPGFAELVESLTKEWRKHAKVRRGKFGREYYNGWIKGLDGRRIHISSEHMILVYMLQSDEAIMMSAAICFLYDWCCKKGWKWGEDWAMVMWNHDEYQCEVKEEIAQEFAKIGEKAIVKAGEFYNIACPHAGESDIGDNWSETH